MNVLMTADAVGGVWNYSLELARALEPFGVEFLIATMGPRPTDEQRAEAAQLPNVDLRESDYALEWMPDPWRDVDAAGEWLLHLEDEFTPDVIHLGGYAHGALAFRAPQVIVAHSCVLSWWRHVKGEPAPSEWHTYRQRVRRGLSAVDAVVAPTRAMLCDVEAHYGEPDVYQHWAVIPNAREEWPFRVRRKEPYIFSAGRLWDEAKNVAALERVAPHLPWPVRVAGGSGSESDSPLLQLGRLTTQQVALQMSRAAIYALPARYEPFGLSALEAALSGCCLVLGDIQSLREVWGNAALYVNPDDTDELAATLEDLIADPQWREEMAQRALERAKEYSVVNFANDYLSLYEKLYAPQVAAALAWG